MIIKGKYTTIDIPDYELEYVKYKDWKTLKNIAGVYFLMNGWELIYIGQAKEIYGRLYAHRHATEKIFDGILLLEVEEEWERFVIERVFIEAYQPKYNGFTIKPEVEWKECEENPNFLRCGNLIITK